MSAETTRVSTGIPGLDEILRGGLPPNHVYLLEGDPGAGKTTLGLEFLLEGARRGEKVLYLTLLHAKRLLQEMALSHGWDIAGVDIMSLALASEAESKAAEQTLLPTWEVQLTNVIDAVREAVERIKPSRVVFDSLEQFRLLAGDPAIYHQRILAMQRLLEEGNATSIFVETSHATSEFKTLAHGVISLDTAAEVYGESHRRIRIEKMRDVAYIGGYHSFKIVAGGIEVYPRLPHAVKVVKTEWSFASSGIKELDAMLCGGLAYGTSSLILGQAGTGKTTLATAYAYMGAKQGVRSSVFLFDERIDTFVKRSHDLGMDLSPLVEQGIITLRRVDIGDMSTGEFGQHLRDSVEQHDVRIVIVDSLSGYASAMADEPQVVGQLHNTMTYLGQHGVLSLMTATEHGIIGSSSRTVDVSYLADAVIFLRRFEAMGTVRLAVSVIKRRYGDHEKTIREMRTTAKGIVVGQPITEFQGVLTGEPIFVGERKKLME
jgi:circadian clock protein KaiC